MLHRIADWRPALDAEINRYRRRPYDEAASNCGFFVADCVRAMTGIDVVAGYRSRATSLAEYAALLQADGFADHVAVIAANLTEVDRTRAVIGDVAVVGELGEDALGIVTGPHIAVYARRGIGFVPLARITRAFRIEG